MGGFARYPWPQYINNAPFYYNKRFKSAIVLSLTSGVIAFIWTHRYMKFHHYVNPGVGSYIDPENPHAPSEIKLV